MSAHSSTLTGTQSHGESDNFCGPLINVPMAKAEAEDDRFLKLFANNADEQPAKNI